MRTLIWILFGALSIDLPGSSCARQNPSDAELECLLRELPPTAGRGRDSELDGLLLQLPGRDPEHWIPLLEEILAEVRTQEEEWSKGGLELGLLTAIRRLEGRRDPLTVEASFVSEGPYVFPRLPVFGVRLAHSLGETESYTLTLGGDYRGGRLARWDIELTDAEGESHPGTDNWRSAMGGGMFERTKVGPGFLWGVETPNELDQIVAQMEGREIGPVEILPVPLSLAQYRKPSALGRYVARVIYHDHAPIADRENADGLLVFQSEPLDFEWKKRTIRIDPELEVRVRALLKEMVELEAPIATSFHLTTGYNGHAEGEHPLDRLFASGWGAVPVLIDALQKSDDVWERASILVALYDLTGLECPTSFGHLNVVGPYKTLRKSLPAGSGVHGVTLPSYQEGRVPRAEVQEPFVRRWGEHQRFFEILREER